MAIAVKAFRERGVEAHYSRSLSARKSYESIVAHSGGCYQYWSKVQADQLVLVAPPWHKLGRFTMKELAKRARARRREGSGKKSTLQTLRFLASIRSTLRHSRAVREINLLGELTDWLAQDSGRRVDLIMYHGDAWTDSEIKEAFKILPRTSVELLKGDHDDIRRRPEDLALLIQKKLSKSH